jgi:hypothetical protein
MSNPASEETLQELLSQAQQMNATLSKLSSVLGKASTTASSASKSTKDAGSAVAGNLMGQSSKFLSMLGPAGKAFSILIPIVETIGKLFSGLADFIGGMFDRLSKVAGILGEFAMSAQKGNMKLSEMVDVMGDLAEQVPLVGGALKTLFSLAKFAIQRQEETLDMFRKISSVGAGIGTSLETLRTQARATGLTMDEYAAQVQKSSANFANLGGSVDAGLKAFNKNMQAVMGADSKVSRAFFGMGYTAQGAADALDLYMSSQGSMNKRGLDDSRRVAEGAKNLAEQMTVLSEVTGKRREQLEAEVKEATEEANWKAFTAGLDPQEAENATKAVADAMAQYGPDGAKAVKLAIQTGITTPVNEAGAKLSVATQGSIQGYLENAKNIKKSSADYLKDLDKSNYDVAKSTGEFRKSMGVTNDVLVAQGKGLISQQMQSNANRADQYKNEKEYTAAMAKLREKTAGAGNSDAATIAQQTQNLRQFGTIIDQIIGTLVGPFLKPILSMTEAFQKVAIQAALWIQPYMQKFADWLQPWVAKFTNIKSWEEFKTVMFAFWDDIKAKAGPLIKDVWDATKPVLFEAIKGLFDFLWDALKAAVIPRWMRSDTDSEKAEDKKKELKALQDRVEKEEKQLAQAKASGSRSMAMIEENLKKDKERLAKMQGTDDKKPKETSSGDSSNSTNNTSKNKNTGPVETAPKTDQATNIRNWAYSLMTGQAQEGQVPASIKDQVMAAKNDPSIKKMADDYNAQVAKKAADEKARLENEAKKKKEEEQKKSETEKPNTTVVSKSQESPATPETMLNTLVSQLIKVNSETSENTRKTASILSSNGNLFIR